MIKDLGTEKNWYKKERGGSIVESPSTSFFEIFSLPFMMLLYNLRWKNLMTFLMLAVVNIVAFRVEVNACVVTII